MTAFTTIPNGLVAVGAKPFATTMQALRDNPLAIAEGDATAPKIQDAALDTGAATTAGTTWVNLRIAGSSAGAVGTYAMLGQASVTTAGPGTTAAGSGLRWANAQGDLLTTPLPSGTWRLMGRTTGSVDEEGTTLFLRIA